MVKPKTHSWAKHTVRRWKEVYLEIQYVNGYNEFSSPLSAIFRNRAQDIPASKLGDAHEESTSCKKQTHTKSEFTLGKISTTKPKRKQIKNQFIMKIKESIFPSNPFIPF